MIQLTSLDSNKSFKLLENKKIENYFGFNEGFLNYTNKFYGVTKRHNNTHYVTGTNIFLTKNTVPI